MYERLLLPSDGSELSRSAEPHAAALARAMDAEVLAVRVSRASGESPDALTADTWAQRIAARDDDADEETRAEAYPPLSDAVARLRDAGVERAGTLVLRGEPGEAIVDAAHRLGAGAVVMSSHGLTGLRRAVLGSIADHVIRHSPGIPVLLCPPYAEASVEAYRTVLVALDGSELAGGLVPHAAELARRTGAELLLLQVIDSPFRILAMTTPAGYPVTPGLTPEAADEVARAQRTSAEQHLEAVATELRQAGAEAVTPRIVEGEAGEAIVTAAAEAGADLVLLATHGRGGLGRALLGSVTDYVTRHLTSAAALVVPPASR